MTNINIVRDGRKYNMTDHIDAFDLDCNRHAVIVERLILTWLTNFDDDDDDAHDLAIDAITNEIGSDADLATNDTAWRWRAIALRAAFMAAVHIANRHGGLAAARTETEQRLAYLLDYRERR